MTAAESYSLIAEGKYLWSKPNQFKISYKAAGGFAPASLKTWLSHWEAEEMGREPSTEEDPATAAWRPAGRGWAQVTSALPEQLSLMDPGTAVPFKLVCAVDPCLSCPVSHLFASLSLKDNPWAPLSASSFYVCLLLKWLCFLCACSVGKCAVARVKAQLDGKKFQPWKVLAMLQVVTSVMVPKGRSAQVVKARRKTGSRKTTGMCPREKSFGTAYLKQAC